MESYSQKDLKQISITEETEEAVILNELKNGRATILKNVKRNIKPVIVGRKFKCKYNLNLGVSPKKSSIENELKKLNIAISMGADTVMDLSVGRDRDKTRMELLRNCGVPFGTVPVYTMIDSDEDIKNLSKNFILESIEKQCEEGVDFMTIHAGLLKMSSKYIEKRLTGIVSRGGSLIFRYIKETGKENPFYTYFEEIVKILRKYNVTISIGDGLRPGSINDSTDKAQIFELKVIGELNSYCRKNGVFTMIEGPGHIPINEIEKNVKLAIKYSSDAPLYFLGPLVTDIAIGYDHVNGAIGGAIAGYMGVSLICAVGPSEHIGLPTIEDIRSECAVFSMVKHSVNLARGFKKERERDYNLSLARKNFKWEEQFSLSIDSEHARKRFIELNNSNEDHCSMCGKSFCTMRNTKKAMDSVV